MYEWLNAHLIEEGLASEPPAVKEAVLDALVRVADKPHEPEGVVARCMLPTREVPERRVAFLPYGWALVYQPYTNGPPPWAGPHVCVLGFRHYDWTDSRSPKGPDPAP